MRGGFVQGAQGRARLRLRRPGARLASLAPLPWTPSSVSEGLARKLARPPGPPTMRGVDGHLPVPGITSERRMVEPMAPAAVVVRELLLVAAGALFLALTAQISVPLPFSEVPLTGQTLGVLLLGALYGPRRGVVTVVAYLAEGAVGLPVFALGRSGLAVLLGPTGGFLIGFVPAAFIAGFAGGSRRAAVRLGILLFATLVVYGFGVPWLAATRAMPVLAALVAGMLPFVPGDVIKAGLAAGVTPAGSRLLAALPGFRAR